MNKDFKGFFITEDHFNDSNYSFTIKPNFSSLGSIIEISRHESLYIFGHGECLQDPLGLNASTIGEEYNLKPIPVDILSFDNTFLETDLAQGR